MTKGFSEAERLMLAAAIAPSLRSMPEAQRMRRVALERDGVVVGFITVGELQDKLLERYALDCDRHIEGSDAPCRACGRAVGQSTNRRGARRKFCGVHCQRLFACIGYACIRCGKQATAKPACSPENYRCLECHNEIAKPKRCPSGHEITPENSFFSGRKKRKRFCRPCRQAQKTAQRAKRRASR